MVAIPYLVLLHLLAVAVAAVTALRFHRRVGQAVLEEAQLMMPFPGVEPQIKVMPEALAQVVVLRLTAVAAVVLEALEGQALPLVLGMAVLASLRQSLEVPWVVQVAAGAPEAGVTEPHRLAAAQETTPETQQTARPTLAGVVGPQDKPCPETVVLVL